MLLTFPKVKSSNPSFGAMKCKRSSDGSGHSHESRQTMRQQAVKAVREGEAATQVPTT